MEEFSYLILGDEPAGLWLARRLVEELKEASPRPRVGWLSLSKTPRPTCLPVEPALEYFSAPPTEDAWSAEIVTPKGSTIWSDEGIGARFPSLKPLLESGAALPAIRRALRDDPDLLSLSSAIWRYLGRAEGLHAESIIAGALSCRKLRWWSPALELPPEVERISLSPRENLVETVQPRRSGGFSVSFRGRHPFVAKKWILNLDLRALEILSGEHPDFFDLLNSNHAVLAHHALYPMTIRASSQVFCSPSKPLTILLDAEEIPDPGSEIWPLVYQSQAEESVLSLFASSPRELSLDTTLDTFRQGVRRLNRLFPFLSRSLSTVSPPLSMETCFSDAHRTAVLNELEDASVELYTMTTGLTQTRSHSLAALFPFTNCHLPYPVGTLQAAKGLLVEAIRAAKWKAKPKSPSPDSGTSTSA